MRHALYATALDTTLKMAGYTLMLAFKERLDILGIGGEKNGFVECILLIFIFLVLTRRKLILDVIDLAQESRGLALYGTWMPSHTNFLTEA
jgi:hypothetical protein